MEPPNNGDEAFCPFREVVLSLEVKKCTSINGKSGTLGPQSVSFIERYFLLCPLFGVSFIGGSTVD